MESHGDQNTLQSYALALLTLWRNQEGADGPNPPLGWAFRLETQTSIYNLAAHRLLPALIEHSPSPEVVARQFMTELGRCDYDDVITHGDALSTLNDKFYVEYYVQVNLLNSDRSSSPTDWAVVAHGIITQNNVKMDTLTSLAALYLNDLVIQCRVQCNIY